LKRLRTDHFDLYQFHAVASMDDVKKILAPGGAAEVFLKAKQEGKTKYVGFSAHNAEAAVPPGDEKLFAMALDIGAGFKKLNKKEQAQVAQWAKGTEPLFRA
jgi:predicted aldo/keto reductase-like oxidoreductase